VNNPSDYTQIAVTTKLSPQRRLKSSMFQYLKQLAVGPRFHELINQMNLENGIFIQTDIPRNKGQRQKISTHFSGT